MPLAKVIVDINQQSIVIKISDAELVVNVNYDPQAFPVGDYVVSRGDFANRDQLIVSQGENWLMHRLYVGSDISEAEEERRKLEHYEKHVLAPSLEDIVPEEE